ncbi:CAP domain-containing protein [Halosimplex aquaticum]|uniref:CAP domain-containing protein n=1 Tax=Halosimplex aquaticum TaxID=3026162 RepID=A0ABD5Y0P0_9EURY|nr:CAP domain-containing protein [Halosimplex aquaticum]
MATKELLFVGLGAALAVAGVVAVTDMGPVQVSVQVEETGGSGTDEVEVPNGGEGISLLDEETATTAEEHESGVKGTDPPTVDPTPTPEPPTVPPTDERETDLDISKIEFAIHNRVNEIRTERGLSRLRMAPKLRAAARYHSRDMAEAGYFAHTSPDGETRADRYDRFGYQCRIDTGVGDEFVTGAENIAYTWANVTVESDEGSISYNGNETAIGRGIVAQWMDSEGHRENVLRSYWAHEGVGVATAEVDGEVKVYATQNFC